MQKRVRQFMVWFVIISFFFPYLPTQAVDESAFNPNHLLSDDELQNYQSLDRDDIQAFLDLHRGYLASLRLEDASSTIRLASDIIYRAAQQYRINPKYLLVKLQKEQSLITEPNPTQKQIDWATGYGVCDSCTTSDPAIQKHKGFGIQVDSAAAIMRWYYDNLEKEPWIKRVGLSYLIDGNSVQPATLATAFLYTYTPHLQGNRNFWTLWQRWFEQIYPDGSLLKIANEPAVYLIRNGKKYPFVNLGALVTRFNPKLILTVPETEIGRYDTGPAIALPNYAVLKSDNQYYLLDDNRLRPFANYEVVKGLGYHPDEILAVSTTDLLPYEPGRLITATVSPPLGRLIRLKENKKLYYIEDQTISPVTDEQLAKVNFSHLKETAVNAADLSDLTQDEGIKFKDGTLLAINGSNKVYVIEKGYKRHITDEKVFTGLGYKWDNIVWTDQFTGLSHPTGQPVYLRAEVQVDDVSDRIANGPAIAQASALTAPKGKMIATPAEKTKFIGDKFDTAINTYLVAEAGTGKILAGKNIDDVRPLASFLKVLSAYQLMLEGLDLNRSVAYEPEKHQTLYRRFRLAPGEAVLNRDLLLAVLVSSLNTPTRMLVSSVETNESAFIKRLNDRALGLGLAKTKFIDTTGERLENETTAREYLTIYLAATKNVAVSRALGTKSYEYYELLDTDGQPRHYDNHSNDLMHKTSLPFTIISSKTGYLDEAGAGLAMESERKTDGKRFIIITMGNPDYGNRFAEPEKLAVWVMNNF